MGIMKTIRLRRRRDTADEESQSTGGTSADVNEDEGEDPEDMSSSGTVSAPPRIDFEKVNGMKKSAIWALVEDQQDALKAFNGMIKARWATHKKKDRSIRRDWKAVTSKFDGL